MALSLDGAPRHLIVVFSKCPFLPRFSTTWPSALVVGLLFFGGWALGWEYFQAWGCGDGISVTPGIGRDPGIGQDHANNHPNYRGLRL